MFHGKPGDFLALALPTPTLYTSIDSTVTYSRLGSTIQMVNSVTGRCSIYIRLALTKSSVPYETLLWLERVVGMSAEGTRPDANQ